MTQFVKRQTGADALQFLTEASAGQMIEALKDWAARDAAQRRRRQCFLYRRHP
ncbi:MAG: phage protein GemA/Gp16 family protein [Paracoccaceae bacterium]